MPLLQIDGTPIAEIDEDTASKLRNAAKPCIGKVREPATFRPSPPRAMPRAPAGPSFAIDVTVDFPMPG